MENPIVRNGWWLGVAPWLRKPPNGDGNLTHHGTLQAVDNHHFYSVTDGSGVRLSHLDQRATDIQVNWEAKPWVKICKNTCNNRKKQITIKQDEQSGRIMGYGSVISTLKKRYLHTLSGFQALLGGAYLSGFCSTQFSFLEHFPGNPRVFQTIYVG